jgi:hypothetical protein
LAQGGRGQKRKKRRSVATPAPRSAGDRQQPESADAKARGYARGRLKDEEARAKLEPLEPGERPTAVTVGAVVALLAALANLVAFLANLGDGNSRKLAGTLLPVFLLLLIAWGMWRAKYWAVLGMQTLLALTIVGSALAGIQAQNARAAVVVVVLIGLCAPLFWFLVKAMARIQMPAPPSARR